MPFFGVIKSLLDVATSIVNKSTKLKEQCRVPLFAGDVVTETLPLSLSIETSGGVSTVLLPRGTPLPTERRENFSTASDNQASIEVHVLVGDLTLAANNVTVGKFAIIEIPPAPPGVPVFEVTFGINDKGTFQFSARDRVTGKSQSISTAGSLSNPLSQATVDSMLRLAIAEEAKGEAGIEVTTPDDLDSLKVYTTKLRDLVERTRTSLKRAANLSAADRQACEEQLQKAELVLEENARPDRSSVKLSVIKVDAVITALQSLDEAAQRCK